MAKHRGPVLVDTNTIIECWRLGAWRALSGGYGVETVEICVEETQTGAQNRRPEQRIDLAELRARLKAIHRVGLPELAAAIARDPDIAALDPGERHLWTHALTRSDTWVLCGPDGASVRMGLWLGLRDRLVPLERLLAEVGFTTGSLRSNHTRRWLEQKIAQLRALEGLPP